MTTIDQPTQLLGEQAKAGDAPFGKNRKTLFYIGLVLVSLSLVFGLTTYLILTGLTPIQPRHSVVVTVLLINSILIICMILLIAVHFYELWKNKKHGRAGAKLHSSFVRQFSIVAALPAILLAIFASISLDRGLDHLFSTHTKNLVRDSLEVAKTYITEHSEVIRADMLAVASAVEKELPKVLNSKKSIKKMLQFQSALRALPSLYLIHKDGQLIAKGGSAPDTYQKPRAGSLGAARDGTVIIIPPTRTNKIGAIKKLSNFTDTYLYALRRVNPKVISHLQQARANVYEYRELEQRRTGVQIAFALTYVAIALTLLLAAIWLGLWFANSLTEPIRRLIGAAQSVSEGDLDTVIHLKPHHGELAQLGSTFNNMTAEIKSQQNELIDTNLMLDERRRFIEAVLSGVSAGVIGLDAFGIVDHVNRSAEQLLGRSGDELLGKRLELAVPEFLPAILMAKQGEDGNDTLIQDDIELGVNGVERHFAVRLTRESSEDHEYGFVLTFDDTTELVRAQRSSAWADVAQRIAHEMKNPLTPIQLSAERIRRKYGPVIGEDRGVLDTCTDTIVSRVADIKRMVDEFSEFARMPDPVMELYDLRDIVRDVITLYDSPDDKLELTISIPDSPIISLCDKGFISQALINLVKNATEAVGCAHDKKPLLKTYQGRIQVALKGGNNEYEIEVTDNGCGLPIEQRNRLLEPYMTTRKKGTGLGLAIVQKITEQHGGRILLEDAPKTKPNETGARVRLILPYKKKNSFKVKPVTIPINTKSLTKDLGENSSSSADASRNEGENYRV
ncbi:MAG: PAS domain-containing sensor histidine kinase [Hyphomicrobiaceae bacterium]|nr:PAS domain-containing sensor histidine kinase [Hyphomicrobiaceae bacterium]